MKKKHVNELQQIFNVCKSFGINVDIVTIGSKNDEQISVIFATMNDINAMIIPYSYDNHNQDSFIKFCDRHKIVWSIINMSDGIDQYSNISEFIFEAGLLRQ